MVYDELKCRKTHCGFGTFFLQGLPGLLESPGCLLVPPFFSDASWVALTRTHIFQSGSFYALETQVRNYARQGPRNGAKKEVLWRRFGVFSATHVCFFLGLGALAICVPLSSDNQIFIGSGRRVPQIFTVLGDL